MEQNKGVVDTDSNGIVKAFREKSVIDGDLINIGYMVMNPAIFDRIDNDFSAFEKKPLNSLVKEEQLVSYAHDGFWQCMDTKREKDKLEALWSSGKAPWKVWE